MLSKKLGKLPARPGAVKLSFRSFFDAAHLPVPPPAFGHYFIHMPWQMLANDQYGDCVWAGAAHETMMWCEMGGSHVLFDNEHVLADYSAVTGFDPGNLDTDQGTDMQKAASYRRKTGVADATGKRHKIDAYVSLHPGDSIQIATAAYVLGAVGIGIQLPQYAEEQFDKRLPWKLQKGEIVGGHYVSLVGRAHSGNFLVVTWGRLQEVTPQFLSAYMDEGIAYLSFEAMRNHVSPEGFDETRLRMVLSQIATMKGTN